MSGTDGTGSGATPRTVRIGTRASLLARTQTETVAEALRAAGVEVEIVHISTDGDRTQSAGTPIAQVGVGVFVTALREALIDGRVDVAVHSFKDLPTRVPRELVLAAVPSREDPRDALIARDRMVLGELPPGAVVGTGSPRRAAQLAALGLGLEVVPIRGNVDTRIGKVTGGHLDAVVLARAGLARLGRLGEITEVIDPLQMLPAPGQGALACECRVSDTGLEHLLRATLHDEGVAAAVSAERAVLAGLGSPCSAAVGALADIVSDLDDEGRAVDRLSLRATAGAPDGTMLRASITGETKDAEELGRSLAAELLTDGAAELLALAPVGTADGATARRVESDPNGEDTDGIRTDDR